MGLLRIMGMEKRFELTTGMVHQFFHHRKLGKQNEFSGEQQFPQSAVIHAGIDADNTHSIAPWHNNGEVPGHFGLPCNACHQPQTILAISGSGENFLTLEMQIPDRSIRTISQVQSKRRSDPVTRAKINRHRFGSARNGAPGHPGHRQTFLQSTLNLAAWPAPGRA